MRHGLCVIARLLQRSARARWEPKRPDRSQPVSGSHAFLSPSVAQVPLADLATARGCRVAREPASGRSAALAPRACASRATPPIRPRGCKALRRQRHALARRMHTGYEADGVDRPRLVSTAIQRGLGVLSDSQATGDQSWKRLATSNFRWDSLEMIQVIGAYTWIKWISKH